LRKPFVYSKESNLTMPRLNMKYIDVIAQRDPTKCQR
jgi:hypothetical protein